MSVNLDPKIIVALDFPTDQEALALAAQLDPKQCRLKVGKEMFTRYGPALVEQLQVRGFEIFLDLKFHDIPNTVAGACRSAAAMGVWMMNVHCLGGRKMMTEAANALAQSAQAPLLIGVTILTSMGEDDIGEVGIAGPIAQRVLSLAQLAQDAGLDGIVCSPLEITSVREALGVDFALVTPGIRPATSAADDQKRIMTPAQALTTGASYLVIGRPITQAKDPLQALADITAEIHA